MQRLTRFSVRLMERYLPDPFVLVLLLTLLVFGSGLLMTPAGPVDMLQHWGNGFWDLLEFGMQMVLILVTGWVLASSPPFRRGLGALAGLAGSPGQAIVMVTVVSLLAAWVNWGFGLVIGALFARQLARAVPDVDYRLLIASAYSGFIVWHGGISGSIPLTINSAGHFAEDRIGLIDTGQTIFAGFNLAIVLALFILVPVLNRLMMGRPEDARPIAPSRLQEDTEEPADTGERPADRLENSRLLAWATGLLGLAYVAWHFLDHGFALGLNIVNFTFLMAGILLHGTPRRLLRAFNEAVRGASGIILQFPFYAGIMGMLAGSGLAEMIAAGFVALSSPATFPLFAFLSAGLVNLVAPSGGGQWAIQAPVMLPAGEVLGVDPARTAMAVAWGDAWTNMLQPFWALPALAIAGLSAKDIMGYCLVILLASGVVIGLGLSFL